MGKCIARGDIPYIEINVCDGCIHKDVCGDKDYLTENRCGAKIQGDIKHVAELIKAEEQGLLVWLPCKVGNTVYEVTKGLSIYSSGLTPYIHETVVISVLEIAKWVINGDFGKTVFLTRNEAEKALEGANRNGG